MQLLLSSSNPIAKQNDTMEPNTTERFLTIGVTERNSLQMEANDPRILATSYMMYKVGRSSHPLVPPSFIHNYIILFLIM